MEGCGHDVVVTSPKHLWLGTSREQDDPPVLAVLVGKSIEFIAKNGLQGQEVISLLRRQSEDMDIVALFFERGKEGWKEVPIEKVGDTPYIVNNVLAFNCFYSIRACESDAEQAAFLQDIGLAIDQQFVGC